MLQALGPRQQRLQGAHVLWQRPLRALRAARTCPHMARLSSHVQQSSAAVQTSRPHTSSHLMHAVRTLVHAARVSDQYHHLRWTSKEPSMHSERSDQCMLLRIYGVSAHYQQEQPQDTA